MSLLSKKKIPHIGPEGASLLIVGEAPGADEDEMGQPFVGRSGDYLRHILSFTDIVYDECRVANVLNYHPTQNNFDLARGTPQLEEGIAELIGYINTHPPKVILALGNEALRFLMGFDQISKWRGSVLQRDRSWLVPTYHPAAALRFGELSPQMVFDIQRAAKVLQGGYTPPTYNFLINPDDLSPAIEAMSAARFQTCDIETVRETTHILSVGFGWSEKDAVVLKNPVPLGGGMDEEFRRRTQQLMDACTDITFHNGTFDVEQLRINGVTVDTAKYTYDTMFAQRVLEPELPIGLDFCCSIYTEQPYYKDDGKQTGKKVPLTLYTYNATDCVVTWKTRIEQEKLFEQSPDLLWSFRQEMEELDVVFEFQSSGMLLDVERQQTLAKAVTSKLEADARMMYILAGKVFNHRSPVVLKKLLYEEFGLPTRKNKKGSVTTDEDAVVSLLQYCKRELEQRKTEAGQEPWLRKMGVLKMLLAVRGHEKLLSSYLQIAPRSNGRIHSAYRLAGTETGRWSCGLYVDDTGFNAQTIPRESIEVG